MLSRLNTALFIFLGILFWFNGAMMINYFGQDALTENNPKLILFFLLVIPVTILSLVIAKYISRIKYSELLKPTVIMTTTAVFLDSIALTWFRWIYSNSFEVALHGAAIILWGGGLGLLFAFILQINPNRISK